MPRVLHVYKDFFPPIMGGIERCLNWMALGVRSLDSSYEVACLVNSRSKETKRREYQGVEIIEVGELGRKFSAPLSPAFPSELKKQKADIYHFHIPNPTGDVSCLLARPEGAVVATYHSDIIRQKWALAAYQPFLNAFMKRCDVIMPTSPNLIDGSATLSKFRDKCEPVPLGMPLDQFDRTEATARRARDIKRQYKGFPLISFVGRMRYYKGLQFLVSAMRGVPHAHALLIGGGYEQEKLARLADELEVADRIHFLGDLSDEDLVAHLQASDLYVLPSHLASEAFGLSQVEAMACGLPVISCDLPTGVPFVNQHNETGLIVPPADDEALAKAIASLLSNQNRRLKMAEAAYRRAREEFSQEKMCSRLIEVYSRVLKAG